MAAFSQAARARLPTASVPSTIVLFAARMFAEAFSDRRLSLDGAVKREHKAQEDDKGLTW